MILNVCDSPSVMEVLRIVNIVINIIKIVVPVILIISCMLELTGIVGNSKTEKIGKSLVTKIVAAILVFLIPTFVNIIGTTLGSKVNVLNCLRPITRADIDNLYNNKMEELTTEAEESLNVDDYNAAHNYLINIKDAKLKTSYIDRLKKVKEEIDKLNPIEDDNPPNSPILVSGTGSENLEYYKKRAVELLNSNYSPTEKEIEAAAEHVGMTKKQFLDAIEWPTCENGHLMNPNVYCNGDMELAALITYLNISGSINVLNYDSGCNHDLATHIQRESQGSVTWDYYRNVACKATINQLYGKYRDIYMRFAVAVAYDLAPVYGWPPNGETIQGCNSLHGTFYYCHPFYIPPWNRPAKDAFITFKDGSSPSSKTLNPYDIVKWRKNGDFITRH